MFVEAKSTSELPNADTFFDGIQGTNFDTHKNGVETRTEKIQFNPKVPPRLERSMHQKKTFNLDMEIVQPRIDSTSIQPCQESKERKR